MIDGHYSLMGKFQSVADGPAGAITIKRCWFIILGVQTQKQCEQNELSELFTTARRHQTLDELIEEKIHEIIPKCYENYARQKTDDDVIFRMLN